MVHNFNKQTTISHLKLLNKNKITTYMVGNKFLA